MLLVGSRGPYPAFDSVSSILRDFIGQKQVIELRINDWISHCPPPFRFLMHLLRDVSLYLKIASIHKREKVNIILLFQGYYPFSSMASKLLNARLMLFVGGSGFYWSYLEHKSAIGRLLSYSNLPAERICHKFADVLITLTRSMIPVIGLENYKHKTRFALPRLDKGFFDRFRIVEDYNRRREVVGFVGLICRRKGVMNFVRSIPLVVKSRGDGRFLLVGEGPLLETLKAKVNTLVERELVQITGFVPYDELEKYYNEMKLCVLPSYAEGVPSTLLEAMACGTPVLASHVGGIPDIIRDDETGFLLRSNNPRYIAERITEILSRPKLLMNVSANAYKHVRENFSQKKVLDSWKGIFRALRSDRSANQSVS